MELEILFPREIVLDDGSRIVVSEDGLRRAPPDHVLELWVPEERIESVVSELSRQGFAFTKLDARERAHLVLDLADDWELHVRIYDGGRIASEIAHRSVHIYDRAPAIYEVFHFYERAYDKLHVRHRPTGRWVKDVLSHHVVVLTSPDLLHRIWTPVELRGIRTSVDVYTAYLLGRKLAVP